MTRNSLLIIYGLNGVLEFTYLNLGNRRAYGVDMHINMQIALASESTL